MATWYGEPYPGFFADQTPPMDQFEIDPKWLHGHETECDFAKLNSAVLTIIHEEKRFPTKEEFIKIRNETLPSQVFSWDTITDLLKEDILPPEKMKDLYENEFPSCWGYVDNPETAYEVKYQSEFKEPECPWNGICYEDFIKSDPSDGPKSALASTKGLNKHTLNHELI